MNRRSRRNSFGTIIATGTTTHPAFVIRWWEGSKRRKRSGFRTRTEASEALARVRAGLGDGTLVEKRRAEIGFNEVARQWLDLHSKPNLRSHADNEGRYRVHVAPFFGDAPLNAITATRILEFRAKLQAKAVDRKYRDKKGALRTVDRKLAPRTVNLTVALVRSVLRFAVASGYISTSPVSRLGRGKLMLPVEKAKLAPPIEHAEDVGRLLAVLRETGEEMRLPGLHPLFSLLVYTGLRRGEAIGLRWADVDLERRIISVRRSYAGQTKSSKHRTVPIPAELADTMRAYRLADPWKGDLCFPNASGEMIARNAKLQDLFHLALARANLPRIRIHDLRHVFASHFVMGGGDIFTLQRILGHSTPQLTSDTYAHLSPRHLAGEADRVSYPKPHEPAQAKVITFEAAPEHGIAEARVAS
jgi:integrase